MSESIIGLLTETKFLPIPNRNRNGYTVYAARQQELLSHAVSTVELGLSVLKFEQSKARVIVSLHDNLLEKGIFANNQILQVRV